MKVSGSLGTSTQQRRLSLCELAAVGPRTRSTYQKFLGDFLAWARKQGRSTADSEVELALVDYFDVLVSQGWGAHRAETLVAALIAQRPWLANQRLERVRRSLRGFRKLVPPVSRYPLAKPIVAGLICQLLYAGAVTSARMVLVMFLAYLRPGEARRLQKGHIVGPARGRCKSGLSVPSIIVAPFEALRPSKTQTFDDTILIDGPTWQQRAVMRLTAGKPSALAFDVSERDLRRQWQAAIAALRLPSDTVMYQLRHAGASADLLAGRRKLPEVLLRGRWKSLSSVRRYGKPGQVQRRYNLLDSEVKGFCEWSLEHLAELLEGRMAPRCCPMPSSTKPAHTAVPLRPKKKGKTSGATPCFSAVG